MAARAGPDDGLDLLAACRGGELSACQLLARRSQRDLLRAGYLLAGSGPAAERLARETLLDLFLSTGDSGQSARQALLEDLARRYLLAPRQLREQTPTPSSTRYAVDDERERLVATLDRLDPAARAALVLRDFGALAAADVARVMGVSYYDAGERVERARARLIDVAGRPGASSDVPVFDLLAIVARDAPSADLWPEVEQPLREQWGRQRRRARLFTTGAVAAVAAALVVALLWLGGPEVWPASDGQPRTAGAPAPARTATALPAIQIQPVRVEPTPTVEPLASFASVPDLQVMLAVQQGDGLQSALLAYDPAANTTGPLLDAGAGAMLSPDGRWLVAGRPSPEAPGQLLLTGRALDDSGTAWQVGVPAPRAVALSNEAVFLLVRLDDGSGLFAIRAYDVTSGVEITSAPVRTPMEYPDLREIRLFASPDGEKIHVLAGQVMEPLRVWVRTLVSFRTGDWTHPEPVSHAVEPEAGRPVRDFDIGAALPAPDGESLYSIIRAPGTGQLKLQFLDLTSGQVSSLNLPFQASQISAYRSEFSPQGYDIIPSNTGRVLYVLQMEQRLIAIVDLRKRRVERVLAIDPGQIDRATIEAVFRYTTFVDGVFSPDGTRLYLINVRPGSYGLNAYVSRSPVWTIDTTSWTIIEHWTVLGRPRAITISGDGSEIYVRSTPAGRGDVLTGFDTASGEVLATYRETPGPEWATIQRLTSLAGLYRQQYGRSPAVAGVEPADNLAYQSLPSARVEIEGEAAIAGALTTVVVRLVDPSTGAPLGARSADNLRYDPRANVALDLLHESGAETVIVPSPDGPGVYRARLTLPSPGWWDARITVINRDGSTWTVHQPGAIEAAYPLTSGDGEGYGLRLRPDSLVSQRALTLRVLPVDPYTNRRVRDIDDPSGFPEQLKLVFSHEGSQPVLTTLDRMEDGAYIGWARFPEPGRWDVTIGFDVSGDHSVTIAAEPLDIRDPSEPWRGAAPGGEHQASGPGSS